MLLLVVVGALSIVMHVPGLFMHLIWLVYACV
jgi:hypothetical protein